LKTERGYDTRVPLFNISDFSTFLEKLEVKSQVGLVEKGEQKEVRKVFPAGLLRC